MSLRCISSIYRSSLKTEKRLSVKGLENCNSKLFPKNTVFVTARGTVGKVALAGIPMAMNQSCYAIASTEIDPLLVYFYIKQSISSLKNKANGAVFDAITVKDFQSEFVNRLSKTDEANLLRFSSPIFELVLQLSKQNESLAYLRNLLLPKLIAGDISLNR